MKKIISVITLLITTGILLSALYVFTQFKTRSYTSLYEKQALEIQKLINNNPEYYSEEEQRFYKFNVDMKEVASELEKRDTIISKAEDIIGLIMFLVGILFLINIYYLVISFQDKKN